MQKQETIRSEDHRRFIASLPCIMTGVQGACQAAHVRHGTYALGKKPSDSRCVPLSCDEHARQHQIGEKKYWGENLDAVIWLSGLLWDNTGDTERCLEIIGRFRANLR